MTFCLPFYPFIKLIYQTLSGHKPHIDIIKNKVPQEKSLSPSERETIRALKREGWTISELASRFKRSTTEIEMLLDLPE